MRKSTFSESKIPVLLKEAEAGCKVNHIALEHGISNANFTNGTLSKGMEASNIEKLKELKDENEKLKRM